MARRRLTGLAKIFYENARGPKSWKHLKQIPTKQFLPRLDTTEIHRQLGNRRLQRNEDICEYFIKMQDIASRGKIKDRLLIDYIIRGIDDPHTKLFFVEAKTLSGFQEKLNIYSDIMRQTSRNQDTLENRPSYNRNQHTSDSRSSQSRKPQVPDHRSNNFRSYKPLQKNEEIPKDEHPRPERCFNCGATQHTTNRCPSKEPKCFKCKKITPARSKKP